MTMTHDFTAMQEAEREWWKKYLPHPTARQRMYAMMGARYYEFFWEEMAHQGAYVDIGAGPLPSVDMTQATVTYLADPLWYEPIEAFPDCIADRTLLLNVLDHADDPAALVRQAYRVTKPGGKALVFVHVDAEFDDKHRTLSMAEVWTWLTEAGFDIERQWLKPATGYDPRAFLAVGVRHGKEEEAVEAGG